MLRNGARIRAAPRPQVQIGFGAPLAGRIEAIGQSCPRAVQGRPSEMQRIAQSASVSFACYLDWPGMVVTVFPVLRTGQTKKPGQSGKSAIDRWLGGVVKLPALVSSNWRNGDATASDPGGCGAGGVALRRLRIGAVAPRPLRLLRRSVREGRLGPVYVRKGGVGSET